MPDRDEILRRMAEYMGSDEQKFDERVMELKCMETVELAGWSLNTDEGMRLADKLVATFDFEEIKDGRRPIAKVYALADKLGIAYSP